MLRGIGKGRLGKARKKEHGCRVCRSTVATVERERCRFFCLGMTSSSGKRIKIVGNKRKEPERSYSNNFLSRIHEQHFINVQDRRLLMERKAGWIPDLASQFGEELENKNWETIASYPAPTNIAVNIQYDPDSINRFSHVVWTVEQCQFVLNMVEGADYDDMERVLCVLGGLFQRNRNGAVVHIRRADLTPMEKYWMAFSHANIHPCSHVSDITINRALFLYCVLRRMSINIGQVIEDEIQTCASTMNNKAPLGHPFLITHLCELAGVNISSPPLERPRQAIDEAYYRQYCRGDKATQPVPPCHPSRRRGPSRAYAPPHDGEPFQIRDMYMSLMEYRLQSIHRGQVVTAEMIIGMYDTLTGHRWIMDEFNNVVAWPEEQAQASGAGAAEAPTMDDDDEDDEDAEEEGEEEDLDDSMG
ncbi:hypothetical protein LR48_Vigan158s000200 [Vigna angularis]|uniref:Putative plant transposon protein domain-containing protein n=1 Tax=Phaseolus angularis TaxID=3914 RepID=A0A0L9T6F3_PHAAN|nr:hypothetical protein LR48_Vigan158s000200 [Vigna angularis]